jgi:hypothetical protein
MEGMAFKKTFKRKPRTFGGAVLPDGLHAVARTGRGKPAGGRQKGAYSRLVNPNHQKHYFFHRSRSLVNIP